MEELHDDPAGIVSKLKFLTKLKPIEGVAVKDAEVVAEPDTDELTLDDAVRVMLKEGEGEAVSELL